MVFTEKLGLHRNKNSIRILYSTNLPHKVMAHYLQFIGKPPSKMIGISGALMQVSVEVVHQNIFTLIIFVCYKAHYTEQSSMRGGQDLQLYGICSRCQILIEPQPGT